MWTVPPDSYQRTSQLDHITCQTVRAAPQLPVAIPHCILTNSSNSQSAVHLITKLTLGSSNTRTLKHSEDTGHRSTLRASLPGNGLPCPYDAEEVPGGRGDHEPVSLLERDRQSGFGPVQTPCYKHHRLCMERSQGNIQFDLYCSLKLQDTPHLTRPNEIKNSTFKYKMGAPLLALCNNTVHSVPLLTPYRSARLVTLP